MSHRKSPPSAFDQARREGQVNVRRGSISSVSEYCWCFSVRLSFSFSFSAVFASLRRRHRLPARIITCGRSPRGSNDPASCTLSLFGSCPHRLFSSSLQNSFSFSSLSLSQSIVSHISAIPAVCLVHRSTTTASRFLDNQFVARDCPANTDCTIKTSLTQPSLSRLVLEDALGQLSGRSCQPTNHQSVIPCRCSGDSRNRCPYGSTIS